MAESWRPGDWSNPYPTFDNAEENPFCPGEKVLGNTCGFDCEHRAFEAGADAMLKKLRSYMGKHVSGTISEPNSFLRGITGTIVIIPDDEPVGE